MLLLLLLSFFIYLFIFGMWEFRFWRLKRQRQRQMREKISKRLLSILRTALQHSGQNVIARVNDPAGYQATIGCHTRVNLEEFKKKRVKTCGA